MKENWMDKLIELLNEYWEYDLVEHNWEICKWDTNDEWEINIYTDYTNNIISKKMKFIEWLIENNKIENKFPQIETYSDYESLIMLLSIQDNPLIFLLSILK